MKQLIDFIPLIVFFVLYKFYDIYIATGALIIASALQIIVTYFLFKKLEKIQLITFVLVAVFGGMTIFLHDANFIKWKVTVIYLIFAIGLAVSHMLGKSAIKSMLGKELQLPITYGPESTGPGSSFTACAIINVYVAFRLPLDVWVNFKVFGLLIATLLYTVLTGLYIYTQMPKNKNSEQ
ncbi:septation protein A [Vibrio sp. PP-XX7]